MVIRLILIL